MSVQAEEYFAPIPESVLFGDISAQAVRLYGVLVRRAYRNPTRNPSRRELAKDMNVKSVDTVDRALKELIDLGALEVIPDFDAAGDRTSNIYYLKIRPRSRKDQATPTPKSTATSPPRGGRKDRAASTKPKKEPKVERSRAQRLPENWKPTLVMVEWAADEFPDADIVFETDKFKDHFGANGTTKIDWNRAWKNWMRNTKNFSGTRR